MKSDGLRSVTPLKIVKTRMRSARRRLVELARLFLVWHVAEASQSSSCKALDPLQLVNVSSQVRGVGIHGVL